MDAFISLPFYCHLLGSSISEVDFEKYNIRIKKEYNNKKWLEEFSDRFHHHFSLMDQLTSSEVETYKNFFVVEHFEGGSKQDY